MNPTIIFNHTRLGQWAVYHALTLARYIIPGAILLVAGVTAGIHMARLLVSKDFTGHQGDYALFAEMARTLVDGRRIYVDYWCGMAPGLYFLLAPFILLLGATILGVHLGTVVIFIVFVLANAGLAYALTGSKLAVLIAGSFGLLYSSYQKGPETVFVMATFSTLAVWCAVKGRGRSGWMFLTGLVFAAGVISKQPLLLELPALLLLALWRTPTGRRLQASALVIAGVATGGGALLLWAWSQGILDAMLFRTVEIMYQYVFTGDGGWHFREDALPLFQRYFLGSALPYIRPLLIAAAAMALVALTSKRHRRALMVLGFWLLCSFIIASIPRGWRDDYFTQTLPALIAIVALGMARVQSMNARWQVLATVLLLLLANDFSGRYVRPLSGVSVRTMPEEDAIIAQINQHTDKEDCLWMWGSMAYFNFLTERDSCASAAIEGFTMDSTTFPIHITRVEYMQEMIAATPALLIDAENWGYFPELQKYADRYRRELIFENADYKVYGIDRSSWHPLSAPINFGGEVGLIGYDLFDAPATVCPGDTLELALTWQQLSRPTHEYQVFVQLLTPDEQAKIAGYDGVPVNKRPTYTWVNPGEVVLGEPLTLAIPQVVEAGTYPLVAGLYDVETLATMPTAGGAYARLSAITVLADC